MQKNSNVFFPWQPMIIYRAEEYLEHNQLAFRVPVNMTKLEIKHYLHRIYGGKVLNVSTEVRVPPIENSPDFKFQYRKIPIWKKAIVEFEEPTPDEVKMLANTRSLMQNPAAMDPDYNKPFKKKFRLLNEETMELNKTLADDLEAVCEFEADLNREKTKHIWKEEIPTLLAGDEFDPSETDPDQYNTRLAPDPTKPHFHQGPRKIVSEDTSTGYKQE